MKKKNTFLLLIKSLFRGNNVLSEADILKEEELQSPFRTIVKNFFGNKIALAGIIVFAFMFILAFIMPHFIPLDLNFQNSTQKNVGLTQSMLDVPSSLENNYKEADAGSIFSVGIDNNGGVYLWGQVDDKLYALPEDMAGVALTQVSAGLDHITALGEDGKVYSWGNDRLNITNIPSNVERMDNIAKVFAGNQISFAITDDGELYNWGNANLIKIAVPFEYQGEYADVVANTNTALALTTGGEVVSVVIQDNSFSKIPEEIQGTVSEIAITEKTAMALTNDGQVHFWGDTTNGIADVPAEIQGKIVAISAGYSHFTAVTDDGKVYAWGSNSYGESDVPNISNAVDISSDYYQNYVTTSDGKVVTFGHKGYLLGTDHYGRDVFTRLIAGGQMTMTIGAVAVIIQLLIGVMVGGAAGYYGGKIDNFLMRIAEVIGSIPFMPLAMILSAIIGSSIPENARITMIMVILGVLSWPSTARLIRGQVLAEREKEFVTAAKSMGIKERVIIFRHIIPNIITVIIVSATLSFASSMLTETALSFLGFGVLEPRPTWGNMLTSSQSSEVISVYWWRWIFPALALSITTISINLIGDGLRNAIDPKSNER